MRSKLILVTIPFVTLIVLIWLAFYKDAGRYKITQALPENAVFTVEIPSFNHIHESLSRNRIWQSLKTYPYFEAYHDYFERADSLCKVYPTLKRMLTDRPVSISCYEVTSFNYDFLYVCDLGKLNVIRTFEGMVSVLLNNGDLKITKLKGEGEKFHELTGKGFKLYFAIKGNLLITSCSRELVERSLSACEGLVKIKKDLPGGDAVIDVDHKRIGNAIDAFLETASITEEEPLLDFTRLVLQLNDRNLRFSGITKSNRDVFSILNLLNRTKGKASGIDRIAGEHTAAYVSWCFSSFSELQKILIENYRSEREEDYKAIERSVGKINRFLNLDILDLFTSWVGHEIALIKPALDEENRQDNIILAIQANDIIYARDQLNYLMEQIDRKTPVREKAMEFNGYKIHYFSLKGFFKLFLKSKFNRLDRPYYTFIGDYVVFSNSPLSLAEMIRDYLLGKTLAHDEEYIGLMQDLGNGSNIYGYINTSNAYDFLYHDLKSDARQELENNKDAFLSFEVIGLALSAQGEDFKTNVIANFNKNAPEEYKIRELNRELEKQIDRIESGFYYPNIPDSIAVGVKDFYVYKTSLFTVKGALKDGDPDGCWSIYDPLGKMIGLFPYEEGKINGEARFFYKDGKLQGKVVYRKGEIQFYKEYFPDGTLKLEMPYRKGMRHGVVRFYYKTGHLLCEGRYKKGHPVGKWHYYRITGEKRTDY